MYTASHGEFRTSLDFTRYKKTICSGLLLFIYVFNLDALAQNQNSFAKWQQQKQMEYEKWKQSHQGQTQTISSPQQSITNFINEGFNAVVTQSNNEVNQTDNAQDYINISQNNNTHTRPNLTVWAVIVGVAAYKDINSLNYTDDDAYLFYAFLRSPEGGALSEKQLKVLIDEDANRNKILTTINDVFSNAKKDDAIIFYFSGHGTEGALITHDFDARTGGRNSNGEYSGVLLHSELNEIFLKNPAKYKYMFIDACHSGSSAGKGLKDLSANDAINNYYSVLEESKGGLVMMLSSMGDEVSIESGGIRQGIFSFNIIDGLKGKSDTNNDKVVTVVELFEYVSTKVKKYTNYKQNPVLAGDYDYNMPIGIVR